MGRVIAFIFMFMPSEKNRNAILHSSDMMGCDENVCEREQQQKHS